MRREAPDTQFFVEIRDLNREFLRLLTSPAAPAGQQFGLPAPVVAGLRGLDAGQLDFVAATPGLLAGFLDLPGDWRLAAEPGLGESRPTAWQAAARVFAAGLLTYLWQLARRDRLAVALCIGPAAELRRGLAAIRFRDIQACAPVAVQSLTARHAGHPTWWPALITAARSDDEELRQRCRLDLLALGLVVEPPATGRPAAVPGRRSARG